MLANEPRGEMSAEGERNALALGRPARPTDLSPEAAGERAKARQKEASDRVADFHRQKQVERDRVNAQTDEINQTTTLKVGDIKGSWKVLRVFPDGSVSAEHLTATRGNMTKYQPGRLIPVRRTFKPGAF